MKKQKNRIIRKQKITKATLATLSFGILVAPIQAAVGHVATAIAPDNGYITIRTELHPHHTDHGSWQGHYVNPRSIRAVGYGDGKDTSFDSNANWEYYKSKA